MRALFGVALFAAFLGLPALSQPVPEPTGYRMSDYDAPVPERLSGARTIDDATAHALWQAGKVHVIDVMPDLPRPKNLSPDILWRGRARRSIPGAIWLPDAGFGPLDAAGQARFAEQLRKVTLNDPDTPLMFLCRMDCWMSWNAAKRAVGLGYSQVHWYPAGTTGWTFWDWPTERLKRYDR